MTARNNYLLAMLLSVCAACDTSNGKQRLQYSPHDTAKATHILSTVAQRNIPVLCYHQVRDWKSTDSKTSRVYILPVAKFKAQMQMLHDSGYHTILPGDLLRACKENKGFPMRSVLITFDDGTEGQYLNAIPVLDAAGFKAVFFIMTVTIDRPGYMSAAQIADLSNRGHVIGCHTWDHKNVKQYREDDWQTEIAKPAARLEKICGKPVKYFAYPFGAWDTAIIPKLKLYGFDAAFQLWGKLAQQDSLYTIRRTLVSGTWSNEELLKAIKQAEK